MCGAFERQEIVNFLLLKNDTAIKMMKFTTEA